MKFAGLLGHHAVHDGRACIPDATRKRAPCSSGQMDR